MMPTLHQIGNLAALDGGLGFVALSILMFLSTRFKTMSLWWWVIFGAALLVWEAMMAVLVLSLSGIFCFC
ncbi:hypothetical protein JKG47_17350 [Acidithiobacillus sp. MC6.1]|nr:hypothetical protein [Acidithiobacillus sp. MC6.1]